MITSTISPEITERDLEKHVLQLEVDGLTVVPPEVHGVPLEDFDHLVKLLLTRCEELVGCAFSLESGPQAPVEFPASAISPIANQAGELTQFVVQRLASLDRAFRDLALNSTAVALVRHLIGPRATRFSSHNSFVKWQGDFGYGSDLGLHADQNAIPQPWGRRALTANANWCLTDYTIDNGALAYVPGSHQRGHKPELPKAVKSAVPVEAPKGSMIVFHGATWHGAFPRLNPGMRLTIANYYRHAMIMSQEDIQGSFDQSLANDCVNPELFRTLAGFDDVFPYRDQTEVIPQAR